MFTGVTIATSSKLGKKKKRIAASGSSGSTALALASASSTESALESIPGSANSLAQKRKIECWRAEALAPPVQHNDPLFEAIVGKAQRVDILVAHAVEDKPALHKLRVAMRTTPKPGGDVKQEHVVVQYNETRGYGMLSDSDLSELIQPVCKELGNKLKLHSPDKATLDRAENHIQTYVKERERLSRLPHPIDATAFEVVLRKHLHNEHGLFLLDPPGALLHFKDGVLDVKCNNNASCTLKARARTTKDALSAETCLPYSIDWIKAALGEMELTEDMKTEMEVVRKVFQTLVPKPEDQKMLLSFYGVSFFLNLAKEIKYVLLFVGPANCGKTTLAYLLAWISGKVNQVPASAIAKGGTETQKNEARKAAGGHHLGLIEDYSLGEFDASVLKLSATGAPLCIQNRWTGRPEEIHSPFLAVTLNPEHMPSTKPHGDVASKFLLFDATKHMQQFVSAGAAASSAATVTMVDEFKKKAIDGDYAGPMAYLALSQLSGGNATFSIKPDMSAYVTDAIRTESEAWQVGDPEREQKEAAAAAAVQPILDAYRAVIKPRSDANSRKGIPMKLTVIGLRDRCEGVLMYVCKDDRQTLDALIAGSRSIPVARAREALVKLHARAYPGKPTWIDYDKKVEQPDGPPRKPPGVPKKDDGTYCSGWALCGFEIAPE